MTDFEQLAVFNLAKGLHDSPEKGVCAMEAVAWLEGLDHSDHPSCTCPIIAEFVRNVNDAASDKQRQRLIKYLPRLVGTVSEAHELERAQFLAWRAITAFAPLALEHAGLNDYAARLRALPEYDWAAAGAAVATAEAAARAAWATAEAAARATAWAAVEAATWAAAVAAAGAGAGAAWIDECLETLDGVLAIGPSGGFSAPIEPRVQAYRELVT